jgi:hypothetical protein
VAFRVVALPQEAAAVLFRYQPDSFRVGLFLSLLACAAIGLVAARALVTGGS